MNKDLIDLAWFFLENDSFCSGSTHGIVIEKGNLFIKIESSPNLAEEITFSVSEGRNGEPIVKQNVRAIDQLDLIESIWHGIESRINKKFIESIGLNKLKLYQEAFLSALSGKDTHAQFSLNLKMKDEEIVAIVKDDNSNLFHVLELTHSTLMNNLREKVFGAGMFKAYINLEDSDLRKGDRDFFMFIPNFRMKELGILFDKTEKEENIITSLLEKVKEPESRNILNFFELSHQLLNHTKEPTKKPKI